MTERVLIVAAHADDEALGCGGTIARHADDGDSVEVLFLADGVSSRGSGVLAARHASAEKACKILGANVPVFFDFPDQRLDSAGLLPVVQTLEPVIARIQPTIIYTHHGGDLNLDHRIVHQAVMTALRPMPASTYKAIYAFEVASSTEWASSAIGEAFRPDRFVSIESTIERKIEALQAYDQEMRDFPHARSYAALRALATLRGASVGLVAAEGFVTLRSVVR
ncbi:PIG-L deacetylase family protein [Bradyrhizobium sp. CCBAU 53380]|uniref:PIG-L deacetylase family protein n=1 Tax=Bradyrhizobium sp. CCBAU 53380 TaxID=1325117 RepID=UPI002304B312|nr:PIG-L deacetylase family protein [Bradyrhizobium sp. CCBAU 53380]MDA9421474.1 GlcNAc-PI de-N-acetylase [Bradyrhizobium sp. CCBAU 53380]